MPARIDGHYGDGSTAHATHGHTIFPSSRDWLTPDGSQRRAAFLPDPGNRNETYRYASHESPRPQGVPFEILIVTIGLFIAFALNDLVDRQTHRQLVRTAETSLHDEIKTNARKLPDIRGQLRTEQQQLDEDLSVLSKLRAEPGVTTVPHPKMGLEFSIESFNDTAWRTSQTAGTFTFMPYKDVEEFSNIYDAQNDVYKVEQLAADDILRAGAVVITTPTDANPTATQIDETALRIGMAKMRLIFLSASVDSLDKSYQAYLSRHP